MNDHATSPERDVPPEHAEVPGMPLVSEVAEIPPITRLTEPKPESWKEWFWGTVASRLLWIICGLTAIAILAWWFTRPDFAQVQQVLGTDATPQEIVETLQQLQRDHWEHYRDLFEQVVLKTLVPLFTLLLGYAFGERQGSRKPSPDNGSEEEAE